MTQVTNSEPGAVFSFARLGEGNRILGVFNFSDQPREVRLLDGPWQGTYRDFASGAEETLRADSRLALPAWGYRVLVQ
jgi:hypothetical protein